MESNTQGQNIPALRPADEMPPIVDQSSLEHMWRALIGEPGFSSPQVWLLPIESGRAGRVAIIEQAPLSASSEDLEGLQRIVGALEEDGGKVALLFARPGSSVRTPGDITWARGLAALRSGWPIHLANDEEVRVVAPDDLA